MSQIPSNAIINAMKAEMNRTHGRLKISGHPDAYYISYLIREVDKYNIWGRYGSVCREGPSKKRFCYTDVRVGDYDYDQIIKGGLDDDAENQESFELYEFPLSSDQDVLQFALWRLADAKYREAVEAFHHRKSRDVSFLDENKKFGSLQKCTKEETIHEPKPLKVDQEYWRNYIAKSSEIAKKYPKIKNSYCELNVMRQTKFFLSSEGVLRVWQEDQVSLMAYLWLHSEKADFERSLVYNTVDIAELPSLEKFMGDIQEKIDWMHTLENCPPLHSFSGPALLGPQAAGVLMHESMGHRLEGNRLLSDDEGRTFKDKLGKKITSDKISVVDDPTLMEYDGKKLCGYYPYDDEATPSSRVELVEQGVLRGFLSSKAPYQKEHKSNGHARNQVFERPISRMGNLIIEPHKGKEFDELKKLLIEMIIEDDEEYGVILFEVEGGETGTEAYDFQAFLGEITHAVKVYPDGKEELVRGVDFVGTPLSCLSNIVDVGNKVEVDNSYCGAESGNVAVSTVCPALLLSNLELQSKDTTKMTQYTLPMPWFDKVEDKKLKKES